MIPNYKDFRAGNAQFNEIYFGSELVWGAEGGFSLDISRIGTDGTLYDTDGNAIGTAGVQTGSTALSELIYPVQGGLHFDGRALLTFPVALGQRFTVILRFRDFAKGAGQVHGFLRFSDGSLESVLDDGAGGWLYWYLVRKTGGSGQAAYNGAGAQDLGIYYRYYDKTIPPADMPLYTHEQRYVCDGETVALYLDGVLRSRESAAAFGDPQEICIGFPSNIYAAQDAYTVTHFSILPEVQMPDHRLYRMRITACRGTDSYAQLSRVCLYDAQAQRMDTDARAVAYVTADGAAAYFPDAANNAKALTGNRTGKACWARGMQEDCIYFSLPADAGVLDAYSYITGNDEPNRDPVSWSLSKSLDGGQTWEEIDRQSNVTITTGRVMETQRFMILNSAAHSDEEVNENIELM